MNSRPRIALALALSLSALACTAGGRSDRGEDAERVEPPAFVRKPPPLAPAPEPNGPKMEPGTLAELSDSTTECFGSCPSQEFVVRSDGAYMYLGGRYSHHEGLYFDRAPDKAARVFARAQAHPFGTDSIAYRQSISDHSTRYFTALDTRGRHYLRAYGSPERNGMPGALIETEKLLRELIDSIPADSRPEPEPEAERSPLGPACLRYGDVLRKRCAPLVAKGRANSSCLHHGHLANAIQQLGAGYGAEYIEPGCIFMLESLAADEGGREFVDPRAQQLVPGALRECRAWFAGLLREREHPEFVPQADNWACARLFRVGEIPDERFLE